MNQTRLKVMIAVFGYAYEHQAKSLVSDYVYDSISREFLSRPYSDTGFLDDWFRRFHTSGCMSCFDLPDSPLLKNLYELELKEHILTKEANNFHLQSLSK